MWTAPPPAWNQTVTVNVDPDVQTAVIDVRNGTANYALRWNYTLLAGQSITFTTFSVGESNTQLIDLGFVLNPGKPTESVTINDGNDFPTRFSSLQGNSEYSTLTINMVTEREDAIFQCRHQGGSKQWAYSIRINVTGKIIEWRPLERLHFEIHTFFYGTKKRCTLAGQNQTESNGANMLI